MRRLRLHRDFIQHFAAFAGVVLIVFSFQANYELSQSKIDYFTYYGTLFITCVVLLYRKIKGSTLLIMFFALFVGATILGPAKGLGLAVILPFGYYAMKYQRSQVEMALVCVFFVNFVLVFAQFIGWSESVYQFCHYTNEATYRSFIERGLGFSGFLPQFRPSGIFPSTTYVSSFCVLFFTLVAATRTYRNRFVLFFYGIHMAMLGSTVGLSLFIISIPLIGLNRRLVFLIIGYMSAMVLYAIYLPEQFNYNSNYWDIAKSFYQRLDLTYSEGESVMQRNILVFSFICIAFFLGLLKIKRNSSYLYCIPFGIAMSLPAFLHDISFSIFYWFLVGGAFGMLTLQTNLFDTYVRRASRFSLTGRAKRTAEEKRRMAQRDATDLWAGENP